MSKIIKINSVVDLDFLAEQICMNHDSDTVMELIGELEANMHCSDFLYRCHEYFKKQVELHEKACEED